VAPTDLHAAMAARNGCSTAKFSPFRTNSKIFENVFRRFGDQRATKIMSSVDESRPKYVSADLQVPERFSVAPMMDYTDRHFRFLLRFLTKRAWLYTEMVTSEALIHGNVSRHLRYNDDCEHPVALQLGGSNATSLSLAIEKAIPYGYDAINLNCGCPSDKVSGKGCFGAALMREPEFTGSLCESMIKAVDGLDVPVTVKCRIGVDDSDSYEDLCGFIQAMESVGVRHFIIHARKAILNMKLSPKQNREIPPLKYQYVHDLVHDFPHLSFVLNGGVKNLDEVESFLRENITGVMVGREIINKPWHWGDLDRRLFDDENPGLSRREILEKYAKYASEEMQRDAKLGHGTILKPIVNLFVGERGARAYRRTISELSAKKVPVEDIIVQATLCMRDEDLDFRWP